MKTPVSFFNPLALILLATCATGGNVKGDTNGMTSLRELPPQSTTATRARESAGSLQLPVSPPQVSRFTSEIIRLTQSGVDETVVLAFIASAGEFSLAADQIIYLHELGVSSQIVHAMLTHDHGLAQLAQSTNSSKLSASAQLGLEISKLDNARQETTLPATDRTPASAIRSLDELEAIVSMHKSTEPVLVYSSNPVESTLSRKPSSDSEKHSKPQTGSPRKKVYYPVREPYPVELTAPIVLLDLPTF